MRDSDRHASGVGGDAIDGDHDDDGDGDGGGEGEEAANGAAAPIEDGGIGASNDEALDNGISIYANSYGEAADALAGSGGRPVRWLWVQQEPTTPRGPHGAPAEVPEYREEENGPRAFRRFVALLGQSTVRKVNFYWVDFRAAPEEDAGRLFGGVLPTHPALATIELTCDVPARHLSLFAAALASARAAGARGAPLALLHVGGTGFDRERAQAIATILRSNGPLVRLCVSPKAGVESDHCKLLFRSLASNTTLRRLDIRVKEVLDDTLDYDASSASLQELCVSSENPFPHGAVASLAAQLRTNTALTVLSMNEATAPDPSGERSEVLRPIASALETYNFTLQHVHLSSPLAESAVAGSIRELLRRNRRIRYMVGALQSLGDYHRVLPPPLWLAALGMASRFPTLLYRFFRRGDVNDLCVRLGRGEANASGP
jgi:hypothetical protein